MSRPPRLWFPGAFYHVYARGNNRQPVFFRTHDYRKYMWLLREALNRYGFRLHAYVLMTNHIHLMIETSQEHPLAKFMHWLHTVLHALHQ